MQLGCNTVLFGDLSWRQALERIAYAGFDGAELASLGSMAYHVGPDTDVATLAAMADHAQSLGLGLFAIEGGVEPELFPVASRLGVGIVSSGSGGRAGDDAELTAAFKRMAARVEAAEEAGVTYVVKPHVGFAVHNTDTALRAFEAMDSHAFGINFDATHLVREGDDPVASLQRLGDAVRHVHIRSMAAHGSRIGPPEGQIAGRGEVALAPILGALADIGYDGVLDLEIIGAFAYEPWQQQSIAAESRGYLHRCLEELQAG